MRFRYSLAGMLIAVAIIAVGIAAFRFASDFANEWLTAVIGVVVVAGVIGLCGRGRVRSIGLCFALLGGGYLLLWASPLGPYLPTNSLWNHAFERWAPRPAEPTNYDFEFFGQVDAYQREQGLFRKLGHSLIALLLGSYGAFAACVFHARKIVTHDELDPPDGRLLATEFSSTPNPS